MTLVCSSCLDISSFNTLHTTADLFFASSVDIRHHGKLSILETALCLTYSKSGSIVLRPDVAPVLRSMKAHPDGFSRLALDGVVRSYDGNGQVINFRQLSPEQIAGWLKVSPDQELIQWHEWEGVDGRDMTDEKALWDPSEHLRTLPYEDDDTSEEKKE